MSAISAKRQAYTGSCYTKADIGAMQAGHHSHRKSHVCRSFENDHWTSYAKGEERSKNVYTNSRALAAVCRGRRRTAILAFWKDIVAKGFDDVVYINTTTKVLDDTSACISASWRMNKANGVITNEFWVVQPDGRALLRKDHFESAK